VGNYWRRWANKLFSGLNLQSQIQNLKSKIRSRVNQPPAAKVAIIITESKIPGVSSVTNISRS
jgi:hypothetical protein